jgi:hypothetical protein
MDEDEDDLVPDIYTHFEFKIKVVRLIEDLIFPTTLKFNMELIPMDELEPGEIDMAFTKIHYWLENVINQSVIFSVDNQVAISMFVDDAGGNTRVGNVLVVTPGEPNDQHLAAIFQAKLQAIAGDCIAFGPVEVRSDNQLGLKFTFVGDSSAVLPKMADWVGERSYFDLPWWDRGDGSTLDITPADDADLTIRPNWAFTFDFLEKPKQETKTNGVIVRPEFKPKIIDGGKGKPD